MKKICSILIFGTLISTGTFAKENLHLQPIVNETESEKVLPQDAVKVPYVKPAYKDDTKKTVDAVDKADADKPIENSFKIKADFVQDNKSSSAFKEIDKVNEVLGAKNTAWFNPTPNDKDFSIMYTPLTEEDSQKIIKTEDYKDYRFAIISFFYQNKKQGDQLSILLPSKYENAVRIEKYDSVKDAVNIDITIDSKGRVASILGPNEAVYLNKKQFVPMTNNKDKPSNIIFY